MYNLELTQLNKLYFFHLKQVFTIIYKINIYFDYENK